MKRIITLSLVAILAGMLSFQASAQNSRKKSDANIQEVTFVTSIECKNCVKKVQAKLPYTKGVKDMKITLEDKTVWIKYDASKTDKKALAEAINNIGFTAEEVAPATKATKE